MSPYRCRRSRRLWRQSTNWFSSPRASSQCKSAKTHKSISADCLTIISQTVFIDPSDGCFSCTVEPAAACHRAVDLYAFCPNAPPCLMRPPPVERSRRHTEQQIRELLPPTELAERFIDALLLFCGSGSKTVKVHSERRLASQHRQAQNGAVIKWKNFQRARFIVYIRNFL